MWASRHSRVTAPPMLVDRLVEVAVERHAERQGLDAGIKGFLAALDAKR